VNEDQQNTIVTPPVTEFPIPPTHPMDNPSWLPPNGPTQEKSKQYWLTLGQNILEKQIMKRSLNENIAKNLIIFIGDGMSIATQTATRIYIGDENVELSFEKFPYSGLTKVKFLKIYLKKVL
jgi:alkaline phosphatase